MNSSNEMFFTNNNTYAQSCCPADITGACTTPFTVGCFEAFYEFVVSAIKIIGIVAISISAIEVCRLYYFNVF